MHAVELPARRIVPGQRRPRPLIGLSGLLLFACMFLPAIRGCESAVTPLDTPPFLPPYIFGLVLAVIALWRTARGLAVGVHALRLAAVLVVVGSVVVTMLAPPIGLTELVLGCVLLAVLGVYDASERRVAAAGMAISMICILWFGFWSITPDALVGVHLSLIASIGLFAGSVAWLHELVSSPAVDMPRAAAIRW